jgi:hypothetical protein
VVDGDRRGPFTQVGDPGPVFSTDSRRIAYTARVDRKSYAWVDGHQYGPYEDVGIPIFDPDSERFAFTCRHQSLGSVVVDGAITGSFELVGQPVFSPDGQRLAYAAKEANERFVVVDDLRGVPFDRILEFDNWSGDAIAFEGSDRIRYLALLGSRVYTVFDQLE